MPLARIVTGFSEEASTLAAELRARGFQVQTVSSGETSSEPADLEISLEECTLDEALAKAALGPESEDVSVFIAPGAIIERARPIEVISLASEPIAAPALVEAVHLQGQTETAPVEERVFDAATPTAPEEITPLQDEGTAPQPIFAIAQPSPATITDLPRQPDLSPAPEPVIALTQTDAVSELSPAEVQADSIEGVKAVGMSSAPDTPM